VGRVPLARGPLRSPASKRRPSGTEVAESGDRKPADAPATDPNPQLLDDGAASTQETPGETTATPMEPVQAIVAIDTSGSSGGVVCQ